MPAVDWLWALIGFDTVQHRWFVDLRDGTGTVHVCVAEHLVIRKTCSSQYQWAEQNGRVAWHIRELLLSPDDTVIRYEGPDTLVIESTGAPRGQTRVPEHYSYLCYAFSRRTSRGFLEFYDDNDALLSKVGDIWLALEDVTRHSVGQYPNLRFRVEKEDVKEIVLTGTAAIVVGKPYSSSAPEAVTSDLEVAYSA